MCFYHVQPPPQALPRLSYFTTHPPLCPGSAVTMYSVVWLSTRTWLIVLMYVTQSGTWQWELTLSVYFFVSESSIPFLDLWLKCYFLWDFCLLASSQFAQRMPLWRGWGESKQETAKIPLPGDPPPTAVPFLVPLNRKVSCPLIPLRPEQPWHFPLTRSILPAGP